MPGKSTSKISDGEMEIMNLLWERGPLSINEAHQEIGRPIGYTTIQTRLNRLVEKGVAKKSTDRPAKYEAAISPDSVSAGHLDLLVERVTSGSVVPLVAQLLSNRKFTNDEITELKRFIAEAEENS
ncbi:MAG: BlaI/MecI/CopY family transcriptional regulator [Verrucomicrobiota bacterium]